MRKLGESLFNAYLFFSETTNVGAIGHTRTLKLNTVIALNNGVNGTVFNLQREGRETGLDICSEQRPVRIPGTDMRIPKIEFRTRKEDYLEGRNSGITVHIENDQNQMQLTVGGDNGRGYVSYRDLTFAESEPSYSPNLSALHPPYRNKLHEWRDILVGALEETEVGIIVDRSLRATLGESRGFPNFNEFVSLHNLLDTGIKKLDKSLVPPPPVQRYEPIASLFKKIHEA